MKLTKMLTCCIALALALIVCQCAGATCNAPDMLASNTTSSAAIATVTPNSGCTLYVDSVYASLYLVSGSAAAWTVLVVGATSSACTTITNYFAEFPLAVSSVNGEDSHSIDFGTNGVAMPSGDGPYLCVKFNGFNSGESQYLNVRWHSQ